MAEASLKLGGDWATKEGSLLGFNDQNGNYKPIPFDFTRATTATRVNRDGLIEEVQSGVPRIDFSGDGSLLLEPQRTNLFQRSEEFDNAYWSKSRATVTANQVTSPDGNVNADYLEQQSGQTNRGAAFRLITYSAASYSLSVFAKKKEKTFINLSEASTGSIKATWFDLDNGVVGTTNASHTAKIEDYGDGWYRCSIVFTANAGSASTLFYLSDTDNSTTVTDSGGIYIWGAQLEVGSYATSIIKTSGSAVTRNADSYYVDNIGQTTAYTIFIDYNNLEQADTSFQDYISFQASGSVQDGLRAEGVGSEWRLYGYNIIGSVTFPIVGSINKNKKAIVISTDGIKLFEDGALTTQDLSGMTIPALGAIVSRRGTSSPYPTEIKQSYNQLMIFPTALTDSECIELTTL